MKSLFATLALCPCLVAIPASAQLPGPSKPAAVSKLPALRVKGGQFVDPRGKAVPLRGVNFGAWLVMESHFAGFEFSDERGLFDTLSQRLGKADAQRVIEAWRANWITGDDFRRARQLGFNHVRVPFGYWLLEDDAAPGKYLAGGWTWLDHVVEWSEQAGIYCVLDLHGAPGGQSDAEHTGQKGRNALWRDPKMIKRATDLWEAIARRYKGRSNIAAFDLLNEPMGAPGNEPIAAVQLAFAEAIHRADGNRVVIVEDGYRGLDKLPKPTGKFHDSLAVSLHVYPTMQKEGSPELHEAFFREKPATYERELKRLDAPLYIGEWSIIQEKSGGEAMMRRYVEEFDRRGWSWAVWIFKQANRDPVHGYWGFYRNKKPIEMPDVATDTAEQLIAKMQQFRTDNMALYEPMQRAVAAQR
jgi:hypothetical protein